MVERASLPPDNSIIAFIKMYYWIGGGGGGLFVQLMQDHWQIQHCKKYTAKKLNLCKNMLTKFQIAC